MQKRVPHIEISKRVFNDVYFPLLNNESRYLVLFGGGSSGKSHFVAQRYIYRLLTAPMCNLLVVRQTGETNRKSTFALLQQIINTWKVNRFFKINESDLRITCLANKNSVVFSGLDDPEKIKSITFPKGELTDIWVEEANEIEESSFNQLDVRLRGGKSNKQIVLTFNPVSQNHWLKRRFYDRSNHQKQDTYIYSRRRIDGRDIVLKCTILRTTYKDNKFLDDAAVTSLEAFKDIDEYYYTVYCLGMWGTYGKTVFDAGKVNMRLAQLEKARPRRGMFVYRYLSSDVNDKPEGVEWKKIDRGSIRFVDADDGYISIYEEPKTGFPYVIGGDTSGEGSDYFVGQVLDNVNGKQVATLRHQFDEDIYAEQMFCLGIYYNAALVGIERNFSTYPIKKLEFMEYPKQYVREVEDTITHKLQKRLGFQTTKLTRPIVLAALVEIVRENIDYINDKDTLNEMLSFVRNEKGRQEAEQGAHDDCIMALAIAYYIRPQQASAPDKIIEIHRARWEPDMYEDFYRANENEQEYLKSKWGEPA